MDDRKVKGSILIDFVRMVRSNTNLNWNEYLKPVDWDIIKSIILPSKWYPFDVYARCSKAAFHLVGNGDLAIAKANGQIMGKRMFETTYKSLLQDKHPGQALNQLVRIYRTFFSFSTLKFENAGPNHVQVHHDYENSSSEKDLIPFCHQMLGMFEALVQITSRNRGKVEFAAKQWEGAPATIFDATWQ